MQLRNFIHVNPLKEDGRERGGGRAFGRESPSDTTLVLLFFYYTRSRLTLGVWEGESPSGVRVPLCRL